MSLGQSLNWLVDIDTGRCCSVSCDVNQMLVLIYAIPQGGHAVVWRGPLCKMETIENIQK